MDIGDTVVCDTTGTLLTLYCVWYNMDISDTVVCSKTHIVDTSMEYNRHIGDTVVCDTTWILVTL